MKKRILASLLTLCMVIVFLPITAHRQYGYTVVLGGGAGGN